MSAYIERTKEQQAALETLDLALQQLKGERSILDKSGFWADGEGGLANPESQIGAFSADGTTLTLDARSTTRHPTGTTPKTAWEFAATQACSLVNALNAAREEGQPEIKLVVRFEYFQDREGRTGPVEMVFSKDAVFSHVVVVPDGNGVKSVETGARAQIKAFIAGFSHQESGQPDGVRPAATNARRLEIKPLAVN